MLKVSLRCSQACWSFQVYTARTDICLVGWFRLSVCFSFHWSSHFLPINVAFRYMLSPTPWLSLLSLSCVLSVLGLMLTNSTPVLCVFMQKVRTYHQSKHILFTYLVRNVGEWHTAEVGGMEDGKHLGGLSHAPVFTPRSFKSARSSRWTKENIADRLKTDSSNYVTHVFIVGKF